MALLEAPYPIPLKDWIDSDRSTWWSFHHAELTNCGVQIENNFGDIYSSGFFGKISNSKKHSSKKENQTQEDLPSTEKECYSVSDKEDEEAASNKLVLFFEESFFLMYATPCIVLKANDNVLNIDQAWKKLFEMSEKFPVRYAVYHYFRAKGWVVKCGLKFGSDYIIYKDGPKFNHAQYAVLIKVLNKEDKNGEMDWLQLATLNRVMINCGKEFLICNVWVPENVDTPLCLENFKIKETLFKRWVGSEERSSTKTKDTRNLQKKFKFKPYSN